jgi:DNA mismatch repair ATPase MutL
MHSECNTSHNNDGCELTSSESTAAAAEHELDRVFRKRDFAEMEIVGQFNLGFILAV